MQPDTLATVIRLRRMTVENARLTLAEILRQQDDAERELAEAERLLQEETGRAVSPESGDDLVEAFAAWLPHGRQRVIAAQGRLDQAVGQASQARTVLSLARTALEMLETLAESGRRAAERAVARSDQHMLDDALRRVAP